MLAVRPIGEILILTARDFTPPLYYLAMHFWILIAGKNEVLLRVLSLVPYLAMVYVALLLVERFTKQKKLLGMFLFVLAFSLSPILVYYAFEVRMYSALAFFTLLSSYALLTNKKKPYLVSTIAGLYTHYFMFLVLGIQVLFLYLTRNKKDGLKALIYPFVSFMTFVPWIIFVIAQRNPLNDAFWIPIPTARDFWLMAASIYTGYENNFRYYPDIMKLSLLVMVCVAVGAVIVKNKWKKDHAMLYFFLLAVVPPLVIFAVSFVKPLLLSRYLIISSAGLSFFLILTADRLPKFFGYTLIGLLLIVSVHYTIAETGHRTKANLARSIGEIRQIAHTNDLLYVTSELDFFPAQFYFGAENVYVYNKTYDSIPNFVGKVLIPPERVVSRLPFFPVKAFIFNQNGSYRIEALY